MYVQTPHHDNPAGKSARPDGIAGRRAMDGVALSPASVRPAAGQHAGPQPAVDLAVALQNMPYSDMVTFSLSLARDLLQRDDPAAVSRVAEALIATAQVWHTAE